MATLQRPLPSRARTPKAEQGEQALPPAAVTAERVQEMLREIAFVLHATRVVGRMDEGVAAKKG